MELHRLALHQSCCLAGIHVCIVRKQQVQRRDAGLRAPVAQRLHQRGAGLTVPRHQARAWNRCEGNGHHRLGVVGQAMLCISVGPGPVEHIFAVGMAFDVERAGGPQDIALPEREKARRPASARRSAAALVQGGQVFVAHEGGGLGLQGQQGVPVGRGDVQRRCGHAGDNGIFSHGHSRSCYPLVGLCVLARRCSLGPWRLVSIP